MNFCRRNTRIRLHFASRWFQCCIKYFNTVSRLVSWNSDHFYKIRASAQQFRPVTLTINVHHISNITETIFTKHYLISYHYSIMHFYYHKIENSHGNLMIAICIMHNIGKISNTISWPRIVFWTISLFCPRTKQTSK